MGPGAGEPEDGAGTGSGRSGGPRRRGPALRSLLASAWLAVSGCAGAPAPDPGPVSEGWSQEGIASWYGGEFHGRATASGEPYDQEGMTAAHRSLPFGTWIRVENLDNGRETRVRVTDRGPYIGDRILDLSRAAAREIGMLGPGTARVRIEVVALPSDTSCREVQVGSFRRAGNARDLARRLREEGEPVRMEDGPGEMRRVVLGPFMDREEARRAREAHGGFIRTCGSGG